MCAWKFALGRDQWRQGVAAVGWPGQELRVLAEILYGKLIINLVVVL